MLQHSFLVALEIIWLIYPFKVGHRRMELHRVVQAVLEEENKFECNMLKEKQMHKLKKENKMFSQRQNDRSMHNLLKRTADNVELQKHMENKIKQNNLWKLQLEKEDNWDESHPHQEGKDNSLILTTLSNSFQMEATEKMQSEEEEGLVRTLTTGFSLAGFLSEAGWHLSAGRLYQTCSRIVEHQQNPGQASSKLDLLSHRLESATSSCQIQEASDLARALQNCLSKTQPQLLSETCPALTSAYKALSSFCLQRSQFDQSHAWALKAMHALSPKNPTKVIPCLHPQPKQNVAVDMLQPKG